MPGLFLIFLSLAGTLFLLELGVRALRLAPPVESPGWFWRSPDPQTGWALQPGASGRWFNPRNEYDVAVTINSQGLRDVERTSLEKPAGVFRILLLGDSYVEGLRVPLEQTFGKVLEARLNETAPAGVRLEVIPAGVSGWGTDQQLLWFRQYGAAYDPDLVLLSFFPANDFQNNSEALEVANMGRVMKPFFHLRDGQLEPSYFPFDPARVAQPSAASAEGSAAGQVVSAPDGDARLAQWLREHSALYRFATPVVGEVAPQLSQRLAQWGLLDAGQVQAAPLPDYIPVAYGVYQEPPSAAWQESFALTEALLAELQQEAAAAGAKLAVVIPTAQEQVYPERWQQELRANPAMQPLAWNTDQPNQVLHAMLERLALPYLDLLPIFRQAKEASPELLHLSHDGHWTPAGERVAGESLYHFVVQKELAPVSEPAAKQ